VINNSKLSLLNRILKSNNLRRRTGYTPEYIVKNYISNEIETIGQCIGYRSMWKRLVNEHRIRVWEIKIFYENYWPWRSFYAEDSPTKKTQVQSKRTYYVWHVDGYDKLKPYGFCIHGSIDGYIRRILWLEVSQSNTPIVIVMYYLEAIRRHGIAPSLCMGKVF